MKKSEFYAAMCICIILCSLQTVFAVSYQPQVIQPTKPYMAIYRSTTNTKSQYYTVLDTISGKGSVNYVGFSSFGDMSNYQMYIKITIDGTAYEVRPTGSSQIFSAGRAETTGSNSVTATGSNLFWSGPLYFKTSLKVEVKNELANDKTMDATVNYATE